MNRGLHQRGVNRVILDSRPVHAAMPHSEAVRLAQRKKPKVTVHALVTAQHPMNGAPTGMIHLGGLLMLAGQLMQYYGYHHHQISWRRYGLGTTLIVLLFIILTNLWYMPWELVFSLP